LEENGYVVMNPKLYSSLIVITKEDVPIREIQENLTYNQEHLTIHDKEQDSDRYYLSLYLPSRTALVLQKEKKFYNQF
jgi:hypothetical protein